jgi:hypothetical protein
MIIRKLGVLGRIGVLTLLMGLRGVPMGFSCLFVMRGGFVVVVFWHCSFH